MRQLATLIPTPSEILSSRSATTTPPSKPSAPTGQQTGGRGLATTSTSTAQDLGRALTRDDPSRTLELVRALFPPEIRSSLKPVFREREGIERYEMTGPAGPTAIAQAKEILARSLTPMSGNECLDLLTELKAMTRPTPGTTDDVEAQLTAYLKRLMQYPADVVRKVLTTQADQSPWWPAWSELKERLEVHTYRRRMMLSALPA